MVSLVRMTIAAVLALAVLGGAAAAQTAVAKGFLAQTIHVGERDYKYVLYVPPAYDPAKPAPLIVFLHGAGECGTDGFKQVAQGIGTAILWDVDRWPFLVLFPQKPEVRDAWEQHDAAVQAMLKRARETYNVDGDRLYLTGLSQGGHGTWAIGGMHADQWAAIAPICGYGDPAALAPPLKEMPIWCFHGEADTTVAPTESKALVEAVQKAGGAPKLTTYPGVGHNSWDKAYREEKLYDWFLQHTRRAK